MANTKKTNARPLQSRNNGHNNNVAIKKTVMVDNLIMTLMRTPTRSFEKSNPRANRYRSPKAFLASTVAV